MAWIKRHNVMIECCPTSNIRIGQLKSPTHHPLPRFIAAGLDVTIATDDPGIFDITLAEEEVLARDVFGLTEEHLRNCERVASSL